MSNIMAHSVDKVNHSGNVLDLVHTLMHRSRALQFQVLRDGPHAVSPMEARALGFFGRHPGSTLSALAEHSGRDKAQLARLIKGLRERGLLDGTPQPGDRRNVELQLTAEGQAVQQTLQQQAKRLAAQSVAGFSAAEREQLQALLQRVLGNLA
jgi:DNA-binding MarR family transcriptional regulator